MAEDEDDDNRKKDAMIPGSAVRLPLKPLKTRLDMADLVRRAAYYQHQRDAHALMDSMAQEITLTALVDLLIARGVLTDTDLNKRIEELAPEVEARRSSNFSGPQLYEPSYPNAPPAIVDCESRYEACGAACCVHFNVQLTLEEIRGGDYQWEVGDPYRLERGPDGHCINLDLENLKCRVWQNRPTVCRQYSCQPDERVWMDFELQIPSEKTLAMRRHDMYQKGTGGKDEE